MIEGGGFDISNALLIAALQDFCVPFVNVIVIAAIHSRYNRDGAIDEVSTDGGESHRHLKHLFYPLSSVGPNKAVQG